MARAAPGLRRQNNHDSSKNLMLHSRYTCYPGTGSMSESKTIHKMITIYCRGNHGTKGSLCSECSVLLNYAFERLDNCPLKP
ncbi:MAG: nitrous oxide-stimulated promoter family protein, partial [Spirochaetaceae bacterium]|nr:nitrous oxide-stimulated promoter family protein [Spirochaetaceae bacterium]